MFLIQGDMLTSTVAEVTHVMEQLSVPAVASEELAGEPG